MPTPPLRRPTGRLHILAYHGINTDAADHLSVSPAQFAAQMAWLRERGARVVSLAEGIAQLRRDSDVGQLVALTFDDGYADFGEHAAPVLAKYSVPATLFIVTARIGAVADWPGAPIGRRLLTADALRELVRQGHSLGSHSATHTRLTSLGPAALAVELGESRARLAQEIGASPAAFAYPYGAFGRRERDAVAAAGYVCACSIRGWSNAPGADPFALRRIEMWRGYSMRDFEALMTARFKWPRLTRAAKHFAGELQHEIVGYHSQSPFTHH